MFVEKETAIEIPIKGNPEISTDLFDNIPCRGMVLRQERVGDTIGKGVVWCVMHQGKFKRCALFF